MAEAYVCSLTTANEERARDELHENPKERLSCVATLRDWVITQPHIKCPADTQYLLRFLRSAKFSQLLAREKLEKWLSGLDELSDWLRDVDPGDETCQAWYNTGGVIHLPGTNTFGQKICFYRPGQYDVSGRFTKAVAMKAILGSYMSLMLDENVQVAGLVFLIDLTGYDMKHMMFFGLEDLKRMAQLWQGVLPGRFKAFHHYNEGAVFNIVMAAVRPLLGKKFQERVLFHGSNLENVYKIVPMEMLPDEYLPDDYEGKSAGSIRELVDAMKKDLSKPEVSGRIKYETGPNFAIDTSQKVQQVQASFRRLNVD